jgi:hypothetical protein
MSAHATRLLAPLGLALCCHAAYAALPVQVPAWGTRPPPGDAGPEPSQLCRAAIAATERNTRIPDAFLSAMGRIESGRPNRGTLSPWPWTVNAAGSGHFYPSKQAAMEAVRQFRIAGIRSVDVGCLQVNLFYHPDAFASLEQAFDPAANATYAAKLLLDLFAATGSWPRAAAAYHSMTPALGLAYQKKVLEAWSVPDQPGRDPLGQVADLHEAGLGARRPAATVPAPAQDAPVPAPAQATQNAVAFAGPRLGFNRRFMLAPAQLSVGRNLAAYRAMPVQMAWRQGPGTARLP